MPEPNVFMTLVQTVGVPVALLAVVGYVFIKMTAKQSEELTETHKWVRDSLLTVQRDTTAVVSRCEKTLSSLLDFLDKREPEYKEKQHGQ